MILHILCLFHMLMLATQIFAEKYQLKLNVHHNNHVTKIGSMPPELNAVYQYKMYEVISFRSRNLGKSARTYNIQGFNNQHETMFTICLVFLSDPDELLK